MRPLTNFALHSILAVAIAALDATGAAAAGYLKLGDIKGQAAAGPGRGGEIHVESFSWGATQTGVGAHGAGGGGGAGKVHVHDISMAPAPEAAKGGNVEFEWKVEEGESARPRPSDVTLKRGPTREMKESGEKGGTEDINIGVGELQEATISKSSDKATPKLLESAAKGKVFQSPASRGSLTTLVPAGMCRAGARYPNAELGTGDRVYQMTGVIVTGCSSSGSSASRPMESMSLNYEKIIWK